jgi:hypothetical protein
MKEQFLRRLLPIKFRVKKFTTLSEVFVKNHSRNYIYDELNHFFYHHLPMSLVAHRRYFSKSSRGFGENAFHSMWYLLFLEFKPINCLEIGVYRGQVITLWALLAKKLNLSIDISCISPFSAAGDAVSTYQTDIDYLQDTIVNHHHFKLPLPQFCTEFSNSEKAHEFIAQKKWDLIYIDGSHEEEIVKQDFEAAFDNLAENGIIILDDSSLYFDYQPCKSSFAGHPGPSKVVQDLVLRRMSLLGGVGHNNIFVFRKMAERF